MGSSEDELGLTASSGTERIPLDHKNYQIEENDSMHANTSLVNANNISEEETKVKKSIIEKLSSTSNKLKFASALLILLLARLLCIASVAFNISTSNTMVLYACMFLSGISAMYALYHRISQAEEEILSHVDESNTDDSTTESPDGEDENDRRHQVRYNLWIASGIFLVLFARLIYILSYEKN